MNEATTSIARNTASMMGSQIITWASSFVLMIFLPRHLGDVAFGKLYFGISITTLMALFMDLGLGTYIVKQVARDHAKSNSLLINAAAIKTITWLVSLLSVMAFVSLSGYPSDTLKIVFVLGIGKLFEGIAELIHRIFTGLERMEYRAIAVSVEKVLLSTIGVTMLLLGFGAITIAVVMALSMAANVLVSLVLLPKLLRLRVGIQPTAWMPMMRGGFPFLVATTFAFVYYRVDVLMLSLMAGDRVVGWYGAPYRLFDTLMFFPVILQTAVYPVLARLSHSAKDAMVDTTRKIMDITLIGGIPVAILMVVLARPIISILFGLDQYANSVILLQGLAASLLLVYVDFVIATVLISLDKQRQLSVVAIIATVVNITLNFFLIGYFQRQHGNGAIGATIATALTECAVMGMSFYLLPKNILNRANLATLAKTATAGLVMGAIAWYMEAQGASWLLAGITAATVYLSIVMWARLVSTRQIVSIIRTIKQPRAATSPIPHD